MMRIVYGQILRHLREPNGLIPAEKSWRCRPAVSRNNASGLRQEEGSSRSITAATMRWSPRSDIAIDRKPFGGTASSSSRGRHNLTDWRV